MYLPIRNHLLKPLAYSLQLGELLVQFRDKYIIRSDLCIQLCDALLVFGHLSRKFAPLFVEAGSLQEFVYCHAMEALALLCRNGTLSA